MEPAELMSVSEIVVRSGDAGTVLLKDVARVELGAASYSSVGKQDGEAKSGCAAHEIILSGYHRSRKVRIASIPRSSGGLFRCLNVSRIVPAR